MDDPELKKIETRVARAKELVKSREMIEVIVNDMDKDGTIQIATPNGAYMVDEKHDATLFNQISEYLSAMRSVVKKEYINL